MTAFAKSWRRDSTYSARRVECPLSGVKWTLSARRAMSAYDPKRI